MVFLVGTSVNFAFAKPLHAKPKKTKASHSQPTKKVKKVTKNFSHGHKAAVEYMKAGRKPAHKSAQRSATGSATKSVAKHGHKPGHNFTNRPTAAQKMKQKRQVASKFNGRTKAPKTHKKSLQH